MPAATESTSRWPDVEQREKTPDLASKTTLMFFFNDSERDGRRAEKELHVVNFINLD